MRFWMVIDPRLRRCAFCNGHGYSLRDAMYHAGAWHGVERERPPIIGHKRPRRVLTFGRTWEYLPEFRRP